ANHQYARRAAVRPIPVLRARQAGQSLPLAVRWEESEILRAAAQDQAVPAHPPDQGRAGQPTAPADSQAAQNPAPDESPAQGVQRLRTCSCLLDNRARSSQTAARASMHLCLETEFFTGFTLCADRAGNSAGALPR